MKRSERFIRKAWRAVLLTLAILSVSTAATVWSYALLIEKPFSGIVAVVIWTVGLLLAVGQAREARHYAKLSRVENSWEARASVRPRI